MRKLLREIADGFGTASGWVAGVIVMVLALLGIMFIILAITSWALGHEVLTPNGYVWVPGGNCCGPGDCFIVPPDQVTEMGTGYMIGSWEFIPFSRVTPAPDGQFWRCRNNDGSLRCFFGPYPSM